MKIQIQMLKDFALKMDWKGLAEAYQKSQIELGAKEWEEFAEHFKKETLIRVDKIGRELLKEFSNTPLNKRGNGWDWILKYLERIKVIKKK